MIRTVLVTAFTTAAMVIAGPALAQHGPGGGAGANVGAGAGANMHAGMGGPSQTGIDARANSQGAINASPTGIMNSNANSALHTTTTVPPSTRAPNSQGLMHASPNGIMHASPNSVLARSGVASTALPGLTTGLNVLNSSGTTLGQVSQVVTDSSGNVRLVIVRSATGQIYRLAPNTLSISGGVVTTTSM